MNLAIGPPCAALRGPRAPEVTGAAPPGAPPSSLAAWSTSARAASQEAAVAPDGAPPSAIRCGRRYPTRWCRLTRPLQKSALGNIGPEMATCDIFGKIVIVTRIHLWLPYRPLTQIGTYIAYVICDCAVTITPTFTWGPETVPERPLEKPPRPLGFRACTCFAQCPTILPIPPTRPCPWSLVNRPSTPPRNHRVRNPKLLSATTLPAEC